MGARANDVTNIFYSLFRTPTLSQPTTVRSVSRGNPLNERPTSLTQEGFLCGSARGYGDPRKPSSRNKYTEVEPNSLNHFKHPGDSNTQEVLNGLPLT